MKIKYLLCLGCCISNILFVNANNANEENKYTTSTPYPLESVPDDEFNDDNESLHSVETTVPIESVVPIEKLIPFETHGTVEMGNTTSTQLPENEILEITIPKNPTQLESFISEHSIEWNRLEFSEQVFSEIYLFEYGITPFVSVIGNRVGQYHAPKFGYLTKFEANDGYTYYCIDPWTLFVAGDGYVGSQIDFTKIPFDTMIQIAKYISYGYGYKDFTSNNYFIATQLLIWETLGYNVWDITDMQGNAINVEQEKQAIIDMIATVKIQPSFNNSQITCEFDKECFVEDSNHVLSAHYIVDENATSKNFSEGYPYIENDRLYLKTDKIWELNKIVSVKSRDAGYHDAVKGMLVMSKPGSQDLLAGKLPDPILDAKVYMDLETSDITIEKLDEYYIKAEPGTQFQVAYDPEFKHLIVPNCDASLIEPDNSEKLDYGFSCEVFNEKSQKFDTVQSGVVWTVNEEGMVKISDIIPYNAYSKSLNTKPGEFYIREVVTTNPYQLNMYPYKVDLSQGDVTFPYVNLLRDVNIHLFKKDEEEQFRYLNGAYWEIYEVVNNPNDYDKDIIVGMNDSSYVEYPFQYPTINTHLTYQQLQSYLSPIEKGQLFIHNDLLWKVLDVKQDSIEVGFLTKQELDYEITYDMVPKDLQVFNTFEVNNVNYQVLGWCSDGVYIKKEKTKEIFFLFNNLSIDYHALKACTLNQSCFINDEEIVVKSINDLYAIYDLITSHKLVVDQQSPYISLNSILKNYQQQVGKEIIEENSVIIFNDTQVRLSEIKYDQDDLVQLTLNYVSKKEHKVKNIPIRYKDIQLDTMRSYEYTLLDFIEPVYTFKSNDGENEYCNQTIFVSIDQPNNYLSFNEVETLYPWKNHLIQVADVIEKTYEKVIRPEITLKDIQTVFNSNEETFELYEKTYQVIEYKYASYNQQQLLQTITFYPVDNSEEIYTVDINQSVDPIVESIPVSWTCTNVKKPEVIAQLKNADWKYFENYPYQKNRIVHFIQQDKKDITYIDYDCDQSGIIEENNQRNEEITNTHPISYQDIKEFVFSLNLNDLFIVEKKEQLHEKEMGVANNIPVYIEEINHDQVYIDIIYSLQDDAPSYLDILNAFWIDNTVTIDGKSYTKIENLSVEENILTLKDSENNIYYYWKERINQQNSLGVLANDFSINKQSILKENKYGLSYDLLKQYLKNKGIVINDLKVNDQFELIFDENIVKFNVLDNISQSGYESIQLESSDHEIFRLDKVKSENYLTDKYFMGVNSQISLSDYFNTDESIIYALDNGYLDNNYHASIQDNVLTTHKVGPVTVYALKPTTFGYIEYDDFKNWNVNETIQLNNHTFTIKEKDDFKIELLMDSTQYITLYKPCNITLEILNKINQTIPLITNGSFTYNQHSYQIQDIHIEENIIESATIKDTSSNEVFLINDETQLMYGSQYQTIATYSFIVSSNKSLTGIKKQTLKPMMAGYSGNAYLRVIDLAKHNIPISNYATYIFEDPDGLYPVKSSYSNQWGVVDVSDLSDGTYYWNAPNTIFLQPFTVKKDDGLLNISGLKHSREYIACEMRLPMGYDYGENSDVCIPLNTDEEAGFVENVNTIAVDATNKLRRLDLNVYKIDGQKPKQLLNGAVFTFEDTYEQGVDLCSQYDCQGLSTPMVKTPIHIGTFMSGGLYIQEKEQQFKNPLEYTQLLDLLNESNTPIEVGQRFIYQQIPYTITSVWYKDQANQHILYTDGKNEYNSFSNEKEYITNYHEVFKKDVAYEISYNQDFEDSMIAFTNQKGEIKFVPIIKDDKGIKYYKSGQWYYRKVEGKKEWVKVDISSYQGDIDELVQFDNDSNYYQEIFIITHVYPIQSIYLEEGKINLNNIKFGHDLKICEIQSPFGYLRDQVCHVFIPEAQYTLTNVNHYRTNKRNRRWERKRKGYRIIMKRRIRYRQLGEFYQLSDCALDWYDSAYLMNLNFNGKEAT